MKRTRLPLVLMLLIVAAWPLVARSRRRGGAAVTTPVAGAAGGAAPRAVAAANAFLATLSDAERAKAAFPFDSPQKTNWSNLPNGIYQRNSLRLGDVTTVQRDAAMAVVAAVLSREGYQKVTDIMNGDEVLKNTAARLSVARDRVNLEMDLTAGVAVAPAVFAMIDTDRNGEISVPEGDAYVRGVIDALVLTVDGIAVRPRLDASDMPAWRDMSAGTGAVHLWASASLPPARAGDHRLFFRNIHRSDMSVYLANALVPADRHVEIRGQRRDGDQHELTIDYSVAGDLPSSRVNSSLLLAGLSLVGLVGAARFKARRVP